MIKKYTDIEALYSLAPQKYQFIQGVDGIITIDTEIDDGIVNGAYTSNTECPFTQVEIDAEVARLQAEYDALQYQRDREYPSIGEQLDQLYWDKKNGTNTWEEGIDAVKAAHPKP